MSTSNKVELYIVSVITAVSAIFSGKLPAQLETGYLLAVLALIFLLQSLVRDVWLLTRKRKLSKSVRTGRCMCLESGMGFAPVVAAAILVAYGFNEPVSIQPWVWPVSVALVMLIGFSAKDYVVDLKDWKIRKERDHMNIIFRWRV